VTLNVGGTLGGVLGGKVGEQVGHQLHRQLGTTNKNFPLYQPSTEKTKELTTAFFFSTGELFKLRKGRLLLFEQNKIRIQTN
jgi:hypothetical protein